MSKIDAALATQVSEVVRFPQTARVIQDQGQQAQVTRLQEAGEDGDAPISREDLQMVTKQLKQVIATTTGKELAFDIDDDSKSSYVIVRDQKTGEVITQLPSKEVLALKVRLHDLLGALFNKRA